MILNSRLGWLGCRLSFMKIPPLTSRKSGRGCHYANVPRTSMCFRSPQVHETKSAGFCLGLGLGFCDGREGESKAYF